MYKDYKEGRISIGKIATYIGHMSYGLMIFAIVIVSEFSTEIDIKMQPGDKIKFKDYEVKLEEIKYSKGPNYYRQIAKFIFLQDENEVLSLSPENRLYIIEKITNSESDIYSFLNYDLHAIISNVSEDNFVMGRLYYRPFITYLWLSSFLMALGGLLKFVKKR
jgi:cytochrome c-type biogenesis protein CcmF